MREEMGKDDVGAPGGAEPSALTTEQLRAIAKEEAALLEQAMRCAQTGSATHWPTVAGYLRDEVLRLRAQVDLMSKALQATAYIDRDKLMDSLTVDSKRDAYRLVLNRVAAQPPSSEASIKASEAAAFGRGDEA